MHHHGSLPEGPGSERGALDEALFGGLDAYHSDGAPTLPEDFYLPPEPPSPVGTISDDTGYHGLETIAPGLYEIREAPSNINPPAVAFPVEVALPPAVSTSSEAESAEPENDYLPAFWQADHVTPQSGVSVRAPVQQWLERAFEVAGAEEEIAEVDRSAESPETSPLLSSTDTSPQEDAASPEQPRAASEADAAAVTEPDGVEVEPPVLVPEEPLAEDSLAEQPFPELAPEAEEEAEEVDSDPEAHLDPAGTADQEEETPEENPFEDASEEDFPSYTWPEEADAPVPQEDSQPSEPPLRELVLAANGELQVRAGETITLTGDLFRIEGEDSPFLIDVMVLSAPVHGALLRDGFVLTGGDVFTQEDIDHGRVSYRHEGGSEREDKCTFATPEGEIQPTIFRIRVLPGKVAPILLGGGTLTTVVEACQIADLLQDTVRCHEEDLRPGIAVVGVSGRGSWEYSADGTNWWPFGEVKPSKAVLLSGYQYIRFVPRRGWSGLVKLTYRAWDTTTGESGDRIDLSRAQATGGATAFSADVTSATQAVSSPQPALGSAIDPWKGAPTAADLVGGAMAVVRLEGRGVWQFSLDEGHSWQDFGTVYHGRARLLRAGDRVRFLPSREASGKLVLSARPWDGSGGAGGNVANLAGRGSVGEATPFDEVVRTRTWRLGAD